jgi:hypothetical protein
MRLKLLKLKNSTGKFLGHLTRQCDTSSLSEPTIFVFMFFCRLKVTRNAGQSTLLSPGPQLTVCMLTLLVLVLVLCLVTIRLMMLISDDDEQDDRVSA